MYTKGEWRYKNFTGEIEARLLGDNGFVKICDITLQDTTAKMLANARLIASAPDLYEELVEADKVICELCKRLNPQHATADYGKGCDWCQDRENRLKAIAKAEGK